MNKSKLTVIDMVQSRDLGRQLGGHRSTSAATSRNGLGRGAKRYIESSKKIWKKSRQIFKICRH